jgi:TPR repeat protein
MAAMKRLKSSPLRLAALLTAAWLATTASSCQTSISSDNASFQGSGAAAVAGAVVIGSLICLSDLDGCFGGRPAAPEGLSLPADAEARATLVAGIRARHLNDPRAESWLCRSAQQGHAMAQYLYGSHLLGREDPSARAEGLAWLRAARDQGHGEAEILLGHARAKAPVDTAAAALPSDDCPDPVLTDS